MKQRKNIALLTWHNHRNYGGNLQAFALQRILKDMNCDSEFIAYSKTKSSKTFKRKIKKFIINFFIRVKKKFFLKMLHIDKFETFQKEYLRESDKEYDKNNINLANNKYAVFICGSDQIWAYNVFDPVYFLEFVDDKIKKISYAASIGLDYIPDELKNEYCHLINRFDYVSVRESKGAELISSICNTNINVVLDPSFLLTTEEWGKIIIQPRASFQFIFCYFLKVNHQYKAIVEKIASVYKCKIICISKCTTDYEWVDYFDIEAGPQEFLGYIQNAKIILTDSFHGIAFSLIFNKEFYVFKRFEDDDPICQNSRIYNILDKVNLNDRIIKNDFESKNIISINYEKVNKLLEIEKKKSLDYLKTSLSISQE